MESQEFVVLYTHQKMKKSKVWQDGILKIAHSGNKAILYDDKGACLESFFLKRLEVKPGDDLESDRYLVTVEGVTVAASVTVEQDAAKEAPKSNSWKPVPSWSLGRQPPGVKRRFTGFQGPRQIPKKMAIVEHGEPATSLEAEQPGPTFVSSLCSSSPSFGAGRRDGTSMAADLECAITYRDRGRGSVLPPTVPAAPFKVRPEGREEKYLCSPVGPGDKLPDCGLPIASDGFASHRSGVSQHIRSRARILALLKPKSASTLQELHPLIRECGPQVQLQGRADAPAAPKGLAHLGEPAEGRSTEIQHGQHPPAGRGSHSQWATRVSSQNAHSTGGANERGGGPETQGDDGNLNFKDFLVQNETRLAKKECCEGEPVGNSNGPWNQKVKLESPSFCDGDSLLVTCSSPESDRLLSGSDIEESSEALCSQHDKVCVRGPIFIREKAEEVNLCRMLEKDSEQPVSSLPESGQLQIESPSDKPGISSIMDVFSTSDTDSERPDSVYQPVSDTAQPFLEVTFNLSNFDPSDSEEESQGTRAVSQRPDRQVKESSIGDINSCVEKRCEVISHPEINRRLPLVLSPGGSSMETLPMERTLLSQFCDEICVGFDVGRRKTGKTGKEAAASRETVSGVDTVGTAGVCEGDREGASVCVPEVPGNCGLASHLNKPKGTNTNWHVPNFLNRTTNQTPGNNLFPEDARPQAFILANDLEGSDEQGLLSPCSSDHSTQLLNTTQAHSTCIALGKSDTQVSSSLSYHLGGKHCMPKDTEARLSESEDLEMIRCLPPDNTEVGTARKSRQYWSNAGNSSEVSGLVNNMSLLKSLSAYNSALDSLEILTEEKTAFRHHRSPQIQEAESSPGAWKLTAAAGSDAAPKSRFNLDSQQATSPGQISALSPLSAFPLNSRGEDHVPEFSEESLRARALPGDLRFLPREGGMGHCSALESRSLRSPPSVSGALVSPEGRLPSLDAGSWPAGGAPPASSHSLLRSCQESAALPFHFGSEKPCEASFSRGPGGGAPADTPFLSDVCPQSKWVKYRSPAPHSPATPEGPDPADGTPAEALPGTCLHGAGGGHGAAVSGSSSDSERVQRIKGVLCQQQQDLGSQGSLSSKKALVLPLKQTSRTEDIQTVLEGSACWDGTKDLPAVGSWELCFPSGQKTRPARLPQRHVRVPAAFSSPAHYKQTFTSCLIEHLNILLFGLAQKLYKALSKVDISFYTSLKGEKLTNVENNVPPCCHDQPAKLVMVKKEGPNKGRLFYTCGRAKAERCKFFKWFEELTSGSSAQGDSRPSLVLTDVRSVAMYLRSQELPLYEECQLSVRKGFDFQRKQYGKLKRFPSVNLECYNEPKDKLYLKLSRKENSSIYSKDDLWVVSKTLDFGLDTFIACSAFFGPSSVNEVELLPLRGYSPSAWPTNAVAHALLVGNASTELTALRNLRDHFTPATLPLVPHLLSMSSSAIVSNKRVDKRKFIPPASANFHTKRQLLGRGAAVQLATEFIQAHGLNQGQAASLTRIAQMMAPCESAGGQAPPPPITIIHGVFGAGKSYLLAVAVLFLVQLFEMSEMPTVGNARPWKVLISSSTNVAVDRVLCGLLSLGFEKFVRVGSVRKIAKPVLPYSLHAGSESDSEPLKELQALLKEELSAADRACVRRSMEQHRLGASRALLRQVRVVGVTCAACAFPCMRDLAFPVVLLDECSQVTEPTSLLPIARFECEKLILVGDPKQLPPTVQGSDAAHESGLEQTLFDRLCLMGHRPVVLGTQYRCHPAISAVASDLFYGGRLTDGVSEAERRPLLEWLPTLCFYNVEGLEQMERDSFYNMAEAAFTLKLVQSLVASGVAGAMIGVISLYRSQMCKLGHILSATDPRRPSVTAVQVSTVDAFQGAEKDVVILSCVRTRQVGFIDSEKRVNVALTRARRHLLIVGSLACLRRSRLWGRVIQHCEGREDGLQHASQCEPWLNQLLSEYSVKQAGENQKKKSGKETSKDKPPSQKDTARSV